MRIKSAILLLPAVLLVVATDTLAACAWVLWVQEERLSDPRGGHWGTQRSSWRVMGASSGETECRQRLRDTIQRVTQPEYPRQDADVMYKVTEDTVTFLFYPKDAKPTDKMTHSQIFHYACLPDTVDPRERNERK